MKLGRFEVADELGTGGMGTVYAAVDPELGRRVAVKVLHREVVTGMRGGEARARLLREAQAMARLQHPNVVRVHECAEDGDQLFVVMEIVEGKPLGEWLRTRRSRAEILAVFAAAGEGLVAAHAAGLVHRDFKPDNVLVTATTPPRVRITDFGLACVSGETLDRAIVDERIDPLALAITQTGAVVGTPRFMAPEQFLGEPVTAATDQFAFCVALYAALYGEPPFAGAKYGELMDRVVEGHVTPAHASSPVPAWLRAVLLRGLARDPAARFPSMRELLVALGARRRIRWGLVILVALVAALPVAATIWSLLPPRASSERTTLEVIGAPNGERLSLVQLADRTILVRGTTELATPGVFPIDPAISPSGHTIAFATTGGPPGIRIMPWWNGSMERITDGDDRHPVWLDETHLAFIRNGVRLVVGTTESTPPHPP